MALPFRWSARIRFDSKFLNVTNPPRIKCVRRIYEKSKAQEEESEEKSEFRVLLIKPPKEEKKKETLSRYTHKPPRTDTMPVDVDWPSAWPGPKTFHPASVPLPLRQGFNKHGLPPVKKANTELMKIPNFLHLTPPAIELHCKAIERFCTPWPTSLKTDEDIEKHFPVEIISSDYCHSSPSIRDPLARIVSLRVKLSVLNLDDHAKDKFLRLVGERYDPTTDYVTITTDSCPIKKQNYDYAHYLLTALYFESWKFEEWEKLKQPHEMETYIFRERASYENVKNLFEYNKRELPDLEKFGKAVEDWHNNGDDETIIENYKKAALELLSLPPTPS